MRGVLSSSTRILGTSSPATDAARGGILCPPAVACVTDRPCLILKTLSFFMLLGFAARFAGPSRSSLFISSRDALTGTGWFSRRPSGPAELLRFMKMAVLGPPVSRLPLSLCAPREPTWSVFPTVSSPMSTRTGCSVVFLAAATAAAASIRRARGAGVRRRMALWISTYTSDSSTISLKTID
jgi:hypothetical protein